MSSLSKYDVIVIGAGHNGLTAAAYLGGAGLSTLVLERRDIVGGCCVTEEIAPGCRASTTSYIASMLRPEVIRDLELASHGLRMVPCDPMLGWLEFHPTDERKSVLRTEQETSQPNRIAVEYWASGLEPICLEGAFARAQGRLL